MSGLVYLTSISNFLVDPTAFHDILPKTGSQLFSVEYNHEKFYEPMSLPLRSHKAV